MRSLITSQLLRTAASQPRTNLPRAQNENATFAFQATWQRGNAQRISIIGGGELPISTAIGQLY